MWLKYRYLDDFRRGISVFAIFSYGIAVLGTPQCPPLWEPLKLGLISGYSGYGGEPETLVDEAIHKRLDPNRNSQANSISPYTDDKNQ